MAVLRLLPALPLIAVLALISSVPQEASATALNRAEVVVDSNGSAAATCQLVVLVRALIVLELEDGLGLVASRADETATVILPPAASVVSSRAACSVAIGTLRIVREGATTGPPAASWVFGPPVAGASSLGASSWRVSVAGDGNAVALCQRVVLVESVIIGGGAFGLPVGPTPGPLSFPAATPRASASCSVSVGSVVTSAK